MGMACRQGRREINHGEEHPRRSAQPAGPSARAICRWEDTFTAPDNAAVSSGERWWSPGGRRSPGKGPAVISCRYVEPGRDQGPFFTWELEGSKNRVSPACYTPWAGDSSGLPRGQDSVVRVRKHIIPEGIRAASEEKPVLGGKAREGRGEELLVVHYFFLPGNRTTVKDRQNGYCSGSQKEEKNKSAPERIETPLPRRKGQSAACSSQDPVLLILLDRCNGYIISKKKPIPFYGTLCPLFFSPAGC